MMLRAHILIPRSCTSFRLQSSRLVQTARRSFHSARSSRAATPRVAAKKTVFPERLIIYHAGTGRTVFLGCLKVTTIFIFSFFTLVVAPTHFYADHEPKYVAAAVMLSGTIPMVTVAYMSSPFVNYIHLRLPLFARHSRELVQRYSKNLPKDAELDITTMNFIGKPRVARVKVADLYPTKHRFGLVNYARNTELINKKRPWWMGQAVARFGVHGGRTKIMGGEVWENVANKIAKQQRN